MSECVWPYKRGRVQNIEKLWFIWVKQLWQKENGGKEYSFFLHHALCQIVWPGWFITLFSRLIFLTEDYHRSVSVRENGLLLVVKIFS